MFSVRQYLRGWTELAGNTLNSTTATQRQRNTAARVSGVSSELVALKQRRLSHRETAPTVTSTVKTVG